MAQYWVYLNESVAGPYSVEQLIRLKGFSRQTLVRIENGSGKSAPWSSPAEIPELGHIFKAADEHQIPSPAPPAKPVAKAPSLRNIAKPPIAAPAVKSSSHNSSSWLWLLVIGSIIGGGLFTWFRFMDKGSQSRDQASAQSLVAETQLPPSSLYRNLSHYIGDNRIHPRWDFERLQDGIYHVTLSWYTRDTAKVYAFEANVQAQTVRGLNTAALRLLSEGFVVPVSPNSKAAAKPAKSPVVIFADILDARCAAQQSGDFQSVWDFYSRRKKAEMAKAGMSQDGYIRLQSLTYHVDKPVTLTPLKMKKESETQQLVLLKESQGGKPDVFIKQFWVFENNAWKLDDEEKKSAASSETTDSQSKGGSLQPVAPSDNTHEKPASGSPKPAIEPTQLPGMSN